MWVGHITWIDWVKGWAHNASAPTPEFTLQAIAGHIRSICGQTISSKICSIEYTKARVTSSCLQPLGKGSVQVTGRDGHFGPGSQKRNETDIAGPAP